MHGPTEFDNVRPFRLAEKVAAASFVACISDFARSQLMKLVPSEHWHKLAVVRCGVDTTQFRASVERSAQEDDRLTILSIGRLVPDKGHGVLLSALSSLPGNATTRLRLVIAGDGPERATLERAAARLRPDLVTFLGAVGQDRLVSLYQQADMFCLPSFAEGLPGVLMEAMAMGLPVIATRIMGIPEIVEDGVSGRLVAPGRADALAGALVELLADPELRSSMGKAGRRRVEQEYEIRRSASALAQLYRASLGTPQARNAC
ncbi:MAG: glycosyltransferase family 4 protein [Solirubrobacterales bacterium]|nr:glycosyltransferase family 4 protein [Solirubrobacterales bacterium]